MAYPDIEVTDQMVEAASNARLLVKSEREQIAAAIQAAFRVHAPSDELRRFFEGCTGVVEASREERHSIWVKGQLEEKSLYSGPPVLLDLFGLGTTVAYTILGPIFVTFNKGTIAGDTILFYEATSITVDHRVVRTWLEAHLPDSCFRVDMEPRQQLNHSDATNYTNVLRGA